MLSSGPAYYGEVDLLQKLGIGGVVLPSSLSWDTYPTAAVPLARTPGASGVDSAYATILSASTITRPFALHHIATNDGSNLGSDVRALYRWSFQRIGDASKRAIITTKRAQWNSSSGVDGDHTGSRSVPPVWFDANDGVEVAVASASTTAWSIYATFFRGSPVLVPAYLRGGSKTLIDRLPSAGNSNGLALTSGGSAWAYGSYAELSASLSATQAALIRAVFVDNTSSAISSQVALATGAGGSEVDWGVFGAPPTTSAASSPTGCWYQLSPYPLLVLPGTRLAARVRSSTGSSSAGVLVEYQLLPLLPGAY